MVNDEEFDQIDRAARDYFASDYDYRQFVHTLQGIQRLMDGQSNRSQCGGSKDRSPHGWEADFLRGLRHAASRDEKNTAAILGALEKLHGAIVGR